MDKSNGEWKDRLGIAASALCAVHCAATPILLVFLPTLQFTEWMASPLFHQIAAAVCVGLVGISIIPAYRKHKDVRVLSFSGAGLAMILAAAFLLPDHCCGGGAHHHGQESSQVVATKASAPLHLVSSFSGATSHGATEKQCSHENCSHSHTTAKVVKIEAPKATCTHAGCNRVHSQPVVAKASDCCDKESGECSTSPVSAGHAEHPSLMTAGVSGDFWAVVQPWMTPLGGLLLMVAHGLNMRRSWGTCKSKCCGSQDENQAVAQAI